MLGRNVLPEQVFCVEDYRNLARQIIEPAAWGYLEGGSADELTLGWNIAAFSRIKLLSKALCDFSGANTDLALLGDDFKFPILLAPVAWHKLFHTEGELATCQAASAIGAGMILSTQASMLLEEVIAKATQPMWLQLYIQEDRAFTAALINRAEKAGYKAIVLTIDAPINGIRNSEQRAHFILPKGISSVNLTGMKQQQKENNILESPLFSGFLASNPTWRDVEWLQSITRLPILLKGVTSPSDAEQAIQLGVAGLIVSNHGGRVLDTLPASIDLLQDIVNQVADRVPILMDGGIRRGTDILKALALGAKAVLIGRPYIYALATAGSLGIVHLLNILRAEFEAAMVLTGCKCLSDINSSVLWKEPLNL